MTEDELIILRQILSTTQINTSPLEYRLYYDDSGKVITYTTEKLQGNFIVVTKDQFNEARNDVLVQNGLLVHTHKRTHVFKYTKNSREGIQTCKYDINILTDVDCVFWKYEPHKIT